MPEKSAVQRVTDFYNKHISSWEPYRDAMDEEERFLDGDRYEQSSDIYNRDPNDIQIRGQEIEDTVRHVSAVATSRPRSVQARPIDRDDDPDASEIAVALVEHELGNPWKGFEDEYEAAIISCRSMRLGVVWMDWEPDFGPWGEIFDSWQDPRRIMWDEAYDPHHPLCGQLLREIRMDVDQAREMYKAPWLQPDKESRGSSGQPKAGVPLLKSAGGKWPGSSYDDDRVSIWQCWYKRDLPAGYKASKPAGSRPLKLGERYHACANGCGYRSPTEADQGMPLPENPDELCPTCAQKGEIGALYRVDHREQDQEAAAYAAGRKLVIIAPYNAAPGDEALYEGAWPIPTARSFPGLFLTAYLRPGRPMGKSDTTLMWDQQRASDELRTAITRQVLRHKNLYVGPRTGLVDANGARFEGRDEQGNWIFRDGTTLGPLSFDTLNPADVDPAWGVAFQATQAALTQYRGLQDFGPDQGEAKTVSGVSLQQQISYAEIPTAHFNRRKNRALSKYYGVRWDYIRATYSGARLARLKLEGMDILAKLKGDELPNYDFVVEETPAFTGLEKTKQEAFNALMGAVAQAAQLGFEPMLAVEIFSEINGLPRSVTRKVEKLLQSRQPVLPVPGSGGPGLPIGSANGAPAPAG